MISLKGKISDQRGKSYNLHLANKIKSKTHFLVKASATRFNGIEMQRANGEAIGDVDVAILAPLTKTFFPVEAKSLTVAKTPSEVRNEFDSLFRDTEDKICAVSHHLERIEWLKHHIKDVLEEFGIDPNDAPSWTIKPILVLDKNLLSKYLAAPPFLVMCESEFFAFLLGE